MASCKNPLTPEELKAWQVETLSIIQQFANQIVHQRECDLIDKRVDYDPDSDPMDEYRASQRHERRRQLVGLPKRGHRAIKTIAGWSLFGIPEPTPKDAD